MIAKLAFAFVAGTVATANPCGFGLLPGYLARLLGAEGAARSRAEAITRALLAGVTVTAGFLLVFGTVGTIISLGGRWLIDLLPWAGLVIGAALVVVGSLALAGRHVGFRPPARLSAPTGAGYRSIFLFGTAYGACSLACTLPIFLMVVGTALTTTAAAGPLVFLAYAAGMGSILTALALAVALARQGLERAIRRLLPHIERVSGAFLVLVGLYVVYYWAFALLEVETGTLWSAPLDQVSSLSSALQTWLASDTGKTISIWLLSLLAAAAVWVSLWSLIGYLQRRRELRARASRAEDQP